MLLHGGCRELTLHMCKIVGRDSCVTGLRVRLSWCESTSMCLANAVSLAFWPLHEMPGFTLLGTHIHTAPMTHIVHLCSHSVEHCLISTDHRAHACLDIHESP